MKKEEQQGKARENLTVTVAVLGGGASGMAAALAASDSLGKMGTVGLLEGNSCLGQKILATGNGRCNLSNSHCAPENYGGISAEDGADVIKQVLSRRTVAQTLYYFRQLGIPVREESQGRIYPYSMQAACVRDGLAEALLRKGTMVRCGCPAVSLIKEEGAKFFQIRLENGSVWKAKRVILAMGGLAGSQYGCHGDGYEIARAFGHRIISPVPALAQLESNHPALKKAAGVRARGKVSLWENHRQLGEAAGEIQFTEKGLSGICLFDLSRFLRHGIEGRKIHVSLDLIPELSGKNLLEELIWRQKQLPHRPPASFLDGILHQKLGMALMSQLEIKAENLRELALLLKNWEFPITGIRSWKEAQVTAGGVALSEVSAECLESSKIPGLYFAGELLDVDGPCGGFNLQWAWSSGFVAGISAAQSLRAER